jgi:hypothetical protein
MPPLLSKVNGSRDQPPAKHHRPSLRRDARFDATNPSGSPPKPLCDGTFRRLKFLVPDALAGAFGRLHVLLRGAFFLRPFIFLPVVPWAAKVSLPLHVALPVHVSSTAALPLL